MSIKNKETKITYLIKYEDEEYILALKNKIHLFSLIFYNMFFFNSSLFFFHHFFCSTILIRTFSSSIRTRDIPMSFGPLIGYENNQ